jgi:tRNA(Ile)-lysidine synthase
LLGFDRSTLRSYLETEGIGWRDDPMNAEPRFARSRIRAVWPILEQAGLTKARIADAAAHLARARTALETETETLLARAAAPANRGLALDAAALAAAPREIGLRALAALLMQVGGAAYRPRFERLEALFDGVVSGKFHKARTLHNCRIGPAPKASATFGPSTVLIVEETGRMKPLARQIRT